jgi:hypothetical protein
MQSILPEEHRIPEKDFDRTVQYIGDTMGALKNLDRVSSRFVTEQGLMGQIRRAPLGVALCMGPFNYPLNRISERITCGDASGGNRPVRNRPLYSTRTFWSMREVLL